MRVGLVMMVFVVMVFVLPKPIGALNPVPKRVMILMRMLGICGAETSPLGSAVDVIDSVVNPYKRHHFPVFAVVLLMTGAVTLEAWSPTVTCATFAHN
jgi:hypothetical protein